MDNKRRSVLLIGFMGSGKTTIGKRLAQAMNLPFTDTDERIVQRCGMSISDIFEKYGEPHFRDLETQELERLLEENTDYVISVGGGLPVREQNRELMRKIGKVVYLKASVDTLVGRLTGDTKRPLLKGYDLRERILTLSEQREDKYLDAADICFCSDGKNRHQTVEGIKKQLKCDDK